MVSCIIEVPFLVRRYQRAQAQGTQSSNKPDRNNNVSAARKPASRQDSTITNFGPVTNGFDAVQSSEIQELQGRWRLPTRHSWRKAEVGIEQPKKIPTLRAFAEERFLLHVRTNFRAKPKTLEYYENGVKQILRYGELSRLKPRRHRG